MIAIKFLTREIVPRYDNFRGYFETMNIFFDPIIPALGSYSKEITMDMEEDLFARFTVANKLDVCRLKCL